MSAETGGALGAKLAAIALVTLSVFAVLAVSVTQVSATQYAVSIEVQNRSPWAATVDSASLLGYFASNGTLAFNATATDLPLSIPSGHDAYVTFAVYALPTLGSLSNSTLIAVDGHLSFTVGVFPISESLSGTYTVGQIRAALAGVSSA